jgi:hypothetical protein
MFISLVESKETAKKKKKAETETKSKNDSSV